MSGLIPEWIWSYLYRVFWNWFGILLAIDGLVALAERYAREPLEQLFKGKTIHLPWRYKGGFAVLIFVFAQIRAYHDLETEIKQANSNNDGLHTALAVRDAQITHLKTQIEHLSVAPATAEPRLKKTIQQRLTHYIQIGVQLRDDWSKRLGKDEQIQQQSALAVQAWHKDVTEYLGTIPRGEMYQARFQSGTSSSASYPIGINVSMAGMWNLLESDLARLNEFLADADLGKK